HPVLIINPTNDELCSIHALKAYIIRRTEPTYAQGKDTLFVKANGDPATKHWFINTLKLLLPGMDVAGHSFRAGGTTELVLRGVQLPLIQKIGRWSSDTFYRYIRAHPATIATVLSKAYSD
ncbi:17545_t:CDS:1, partial [Cetraspora pellucida]